MVNEGTVYMSTLWPLNLSFTRKSFSAYVRRGITCDLPKHEGFVLIPTMSSNIPTAGKQGLGEKICGGREALKEPWLMGNSLFNVLIQNILS